VCAREGSSNIRRNAAGFEETAEIMSIPGEYEKIMEGTREAKAGKGTPLHEFLLEEHVNGHPNAKSAKRHK